MLGLAATVAGCENSAGNLTEPQAKQDTPAGGWRPVWSDVASARLRPGSRIGPFGCTAGFLFVDPVSQAYYLSTAAHCTDSVDGTTEDGTGTRVALPNMGDIGTVVFDSDGPTPSGEVISERGVDFSLVLLDPDINLIANPQMISFEGPTGFSDCSEARAGDLIGLYGHGQIFGPAGTNGRQGGFLQCNDGRYASVLPSFFGDSGSPVLLIASGRAMGIATSGADGTTHGPTLPLIFSELAKAGFGSVALATMDGGYVDSSQNHSPP